MNNVDLLKTFALLRNDVGPLCKKLTHVCRQMNLRYNDQSLMLFVFQNLSTAKSAVKEKLYTQLLPTSQSAFHQYLAQRDETNKDLCKRDVCSDQLALTVWTLLRSAKPPLADYSWDQSPCHMYISQLINPLHLDLHPVIINNIADMIEKHLSKAQVSPLNFLSMQCSDSYNFILDVIFCRKDLSAAFEGYRLNIFYINPSIFQTQIDRVNAFQLEEQTHQKFSEYVRCPKCKLYMVRMRPIQVSLGLDEITKFKAQCHSPNCGYQFITK